MTSINLHADLIRTTSQARAAKGKRRLSLAAAMLAVAALGGAILATDPFSTEKVAIAGPIGCNSCGVW